jgi:hypothetical protein
LARRFLIHVLFPRNQQRLELDDELWVLSCEIVALGFDF